MKKILILFSFLIAALTVGAQHGNFTDIRLTNGSSGIAGTNNGTIYYDISLNKFRFRENGSWVTGAGGGTGGSGGGGYKVQSAQPTDTTAIWIDKGNVYAGMYPVRKYVSSAWQAISPTMDYFDPSSNAVSHGRPLCILVWGQSNTATSFYLDYLIPGTGDVAKDNRITLWNFDASTWDVPDFTSQPAGGTTSNWSWSLNLGANNIQTFCKEFIKETGRAVRVVQWRVGGTALSYWEPGGAGYVALVAAATASTIPYFDVILGAQGEGGLGTSAYATYHDALFKGLMVGLRGQTFCDASTAFIMMSHAQGAPIFPVGQADAPETSIRSLNDGSSPYNAWAQGVHNRNFQTPNGSPSGRGIITSSTSINLSSATFPFSITLPTGQSPFSATNPVVIISRSNHDNFIIGSITAYNSGTGVATVSTAGANFWTAGGGFYGSGSPTDWDVLEQDYLHYSTHDNIQNGQGAYMAYQNIIKASTKFPAVAHTFDKDFRLNSAITETPVTDNYRIFHSRYSNAAATAPFYSQEFNTSLGGRLANTKWLAVGDGNTGGPAQLVFASNASSESTIADEGFRLASYGSLHLKPIWFSRNGATSNSAHIQGADNAGIDYVIGTFNTRKHKFWDGTTPLFEMNQTTNTITNYLNKMVVALNPALTFGYTFVGDAIGASRQITLPLLVGNDVMTTADYIQTLTNKTLGTGTKVLLGSDATEDIYKNGGSGALTRIAKGNNGDVLTVTAGTVGWAAPGTGSARLLTGTNTFTGAIIDVGSATNTYTKKFDGLNTTYTDGAGVWFRNSTAAISGQQQISPSAVFEGQGWGSTGGASQTVKHRISVLPAAGSTAPTSKLMFDYSVNGGAYANLASLDQSGVMNAVAFTSTNGFTVGTSNTFAVGMSGSNGQLATSNAAAEIQFAPATGGTVAGGFSSSRDFFVGASSGSPSFKVSSAGVINTSGSLMILSSSAPTDFITMGIAGTTSFAPLKFISGSLTTGGNIRAGQFSFLSDKFYGAITTGPAHKEFTMNDAALTSGTVPVATTNGRLTDSGITTSASGTVIPATNTNDAAAAGKVGEEFNAAQSTYTNFTSTATYQNITSITLTAGDWDIAGFFTYSSNSATITAASNAIFVVSTTTASASGATEGVNIAYVPQAALLGTSKFSDGISPYRVSLSGTTTYYLNAQATFTVGNPQFVGSIRARRVR